MKFSLIELLFLFQFQLILFDKFIEFALNFFYFMQDICLSLLGRKKPFSCVERLSRRIRVYIFCSVIS